MAPSAASPRTVPTSHRSMARLDFPRSRWLHVLLLPAVLSGAVWELAPLLASIWAESLNRAMAALDLNGLLIVTPFHGIQWDAPTLLLADIPAARPTSTELLAGGLASALLLVLSYLLPMERTAARYLARALSLCHASAVAFFGLLDLPVLYRLSSHVESGLTMVWMFMLIIPWLHALSYNIFGFGLWRELALTLGTLIFLAVFGPVQYLFHVCVVQQYSLLQLPVLYLLGGLLLDVLVFVCLYAWAMSWRMPQAAR